MKPIINNQKQNSVTHYVVTELLAISELIKLMTSISQANIFENEIMKARNFKNARPQVLTQIPADVPHRLLAITGIFLVPRRNAKPFAALEISKVSLPLCSSLVLRLGATKVSLLFRFPLCPGGVSCPRSYQSVIMYRVPPSAQVVVVVPALEIITVSLFIVFPFCLGGVSRVRSLQSVATYRLSPPPLPRWRFLLSKLPKCCYLSFSPLAQVVFPALEVTNVSLLIVFPPLAG